MLGSASIIHDGAQHCISITDPRQDTAEITLPAMCEHRTLLLRGTVHEAHHPPSEYDKKLNLAEAKPHLESSRYVVLHAQSPSVHTCASASQLL